ncbi:MAG: cation transporter [Firmicutes bacterium]|jgi:divalent metal cation (Fe/Co/Zn/Cd) transporter|nr:cation transporter [Bacillota bacterium]
MKREQSIKKAAQLEFYVDFILGILVLAIAIWIHSTLLYAQAISGFIGASIAFINAWYVNKNQHEVTKEKRLINGRKEYFFNIALSVVLIYFGLAFFREGLRMGHEHPENHMILMIIAVISIIKFYLGSLTIKEGKNLEATNLKIIGLITRNESFIGLVNVITLSGVFSHLPLFSKLAIIVMAEVMILTGLRTISYYKKVLIGVDLDQDQEKEIYSMLKSIPFVEKVNELIVHDYGYYNKLATVNASVSEKITIEELDNNLKNVKNQIYDKFGIELILNISPSR